MGELILIGTIILAVVVVDVVAVILAASIKDKEEDNINENNYGKDL